MLTADIRHTLKQLCRLTENGKYGFLMGSQPGSVYIKTGRTREPDHIDCKNPYELSQQIDFLISEGYVILHERIMELSYQGLHPYKLSMIELRRFMIKSVMIPIVVALATSLITLLLTGEL